jgi:hypothetical protein
MAQCSQEAGDALFQWHTDILEHIDRYQKKAKQGGFPLLNTCVDGGKHCCKEEGIFGSVHWSSFLREDVALQERAMRVFQDVILSAFGNCAWYRDLMSYLQSRELLSNRLIPGLPITSGWLTIGCRPNEYHRNARNFGVGLRVVPRFYSGGEFTCSSTMSWQVAVSDPIITTYDPWMKWNPAPIRFTVMIDARNQDMYACEQINFQVDNIQEFRWSNVS